MKNNNFSVLCSLAEFNITKSIVSLYWIYWTHIWTDLIAGKDKTLMLMYPLEILSFESSLFSLWLNTHPCLFLIMVSKWEDKYFIKNCGLTLKIGKNLTWGQLRSFTNLCCIFHQTAENIKIAKKMKLVQQLLMQSSQFAQLCAATGVSLLKIKQQIFKPNQSPLYLFVTFWVILTQSL